jgi:hypothetical protein
MLLGIWSDDSRKCDLRFLAVRRALGLTELGASSPKGSGDELTSIKLAIVEYDYLSDVAVGTDSACGRRRHARCGGSRSRHGVPGAVVGLRSNVGG